MFRYIKNNMGIKERADLETTNINAHEAETMTSDASVELAELVSGNMDAIVEIGGLIEQIVERLSKLESK